ncbi:hypothetical protein [Sphingobacterium sp. DR205]|uniref:hypothetical protein n=1 Tax=Sphingobacterium sp. DR205 TaxID=2713573 RepID=UPI0013E4723F|nr:hypothetical protein [Sphingobacterium sp. DR205]QIH33468.1 hypothetical protein G6053_11480 [Sphingobacterium sp. DR205]
MKIELKRIQYYSRQSEETNAFNADLYIDGKKVGEASNYGHGDPISYGSLTEEGRKAIREAEQYCMSLPREEYTIGGNTHTYEMTLESYIGRIIDDFVNEKELQKFRNRVDKLCMDGIVVGKPDKNVIAAYRYKISILQILCKPKGDETIIEAIKKEILPLLNDGNIVLNKNIPEHILKAAGLAKGQYLDLKAIKMQTAKNPKQNKGRSL